MNFSGPLPQNKKFKWNPFLSSLNLKSRSPRLKKTESLHIYIQDFRAAQSSQFNYISAQKWNKSLNLLFLRYFLKNDKSKQIVIFFCKVSQHLQMDSFLLVMTEWLISSVEAKKPICVFPRLSNQYCAIINQTFINLWLPVQNAAFLH